LSAMGKHHVQPIEGTSPPYCDLLLGCGRAKKQGESHSLFKGVRGGQRLALSGIWFGHAWDDRSDSR
jgi:hypothetical protein